MKLTKPDLITIALVVLLPAAAYFGYFKNRVSQLKTLNEKSETLDHQAATEHKTSAEVALARKNVRKLAERIDKFMGRITTEGKAHKAVATIVSEAKEAGINLELIRPGEPVKGKTLNYLPINLTASATFAGIYDFLLRIERNRTVLTVNKMEVQSDALSERCAVKLELRIYFVKPAPDAGKGTHT